MSKLLKNIEEYLKNKQFETREDINNEIKEIFQKIIISELSKTVFFVNNSFHGGTALRLFHNLSRYSKDLDFSLKKPTDDFNWYINNKIKPNYDFLSSKLNKSGPFIGLELNINDSLLKEHLLERINELNFDKLNKELFFITKPEDRIILSKELLIKKINQIESDT